ncbi:hypothetical protein BD626DRAFT_484012 [Schizophyllum amplum]|uniref:Uncharacterized protein n=1 Tax=Schizophyllum amplum TaxID=97359 RepID=A0A550CPX5_9AGAR|nr:hypothetical protein BD626DRAFT_484012 [Auriculariopsis ampla]
MSFPCSDRNLFMASGCLLTGLGAYTDAYCKLWKASACFPAFSVLLLFCFRTNTSCAIPAPNGRCSADFLTRP